MKILYRNKYISLLLFFTLLFGGCGKDNGTEDTNEAGSVTESGTNSVDFTNFYVSANMISLEERDTSVSEENAVKISLNKTEAETDKTNKITVSGTTVTITDAGTYLVSGTLDDGELVIDAEKEDEVHLIFDGVSITNADGPAVYAKHGLITITLKEGTTSTLTDGAEAVIPDGETEPAGACLYSKDNLTINGEGTLKVQANYKDGINCKDVLKLVSGSYEVTAADDGIVGKDAVWVLGGTGTITAAGDGIKSTNVEKEESGYLYFNDGSFTVTAESDGLQADSSMLIEGGELTIVTGGGSKNAASKAEEMFWGRPGRNNNNTATTEKDSSDSMKGIKAGANLMLTGGTIAVDSADDALHSNGTITIQGGTMTLTAGDDGIHAEEAVTIDEGTITITKSYEGIEARVITINGGTTKVTASDDGVNATANSTTSQDFGFGFGGGGMMGEVQDAQFVMTDGFLYLNADGDGLDSNGTVTVNGGTCIVDGPTNGGNGALDYASSCQVSGGLLIAAGSSGMALNPSAEGQGFVSMTYSSMQSAGSALALTDASGEVVLAYTPAKTYSHVVISAPGLTDGTTLRLYTGGSITGDSQSGLYQSGAVYTAGTLVAEFSTTEIGNYFNESGQTTGTTGGFGGFGGGDRGNRGDKNKNPWNQNTDSEDVTEDGMKGGEPPQLPEGEMPQLPNGEMPQLPNGEMPQMPNGELPSGEPPQMPQ